jgi:hypothetical protein
MTFRQCSQRLSKLGMRLVTNYYVQRTHQIAPYGVICDVAGGEEEESRSFGMRDLKDVAEYIRSVEDYRVIASLPR